MDSGKNQSPTQAILLGKVGVPWLFVRWKPCSTLEGVKEYVKSSSVCSTTFIAQHCSKCHDTFLSKDREEVGAVVSSLYLRDAMVMVGIV